MPQRKFRSDDTSTWDDKYSDGSAGNTTISSNQVYSQIATWITSNASLNTTSLVVNSSVNFAVGDLVLIIQPKGATNVGEYEFNKILSVPDSVHLNLVYNTTKDFYNDTNGSAQVIKITPRNNFTINAGVTLTMPFWDQEHTATQNVGGGQCTGGISVIMAKTSININGIINFTGAGGFNSGGDRAGAGRGAGGFRGGNNSTDGAPGGVGEGATNNAWEPYEGHNPIANEGGSVPGGGDGSGAGGGNGTAGGSGDATGGFAIGDASLVTIYMGGGGGGGHQNSGTAGGGGEGSGIIILISRSITVNNSTGNIFLTGGNGGGGGNRGGGAGAGGSLLMKGENIDIGTDRISAAGGTGGSGANSTGSNGGLGRLHADYGSSFAGSTSTPVLTTTQDSTLTFFSASPSVSSSTSPSISPSSSVSSSQSPSGSLSPSGSTSASASRSLSPSSSTSPSPSASLSPSGSFSISPSPSIPATNYSKQSSATLPITKNDLSILYTPQEVINVSIEDGVIVTQQADKGKYTLHQFKQRHDNNNETINITVKLLTTIAPSTSPVYLQIWNGRTGLWETIATDRKSPANTLFSLKGVVANNLSDYYAKVRDLNF